MKRCLAVLPRLLVLLAAVTVSLSGCVPPPPAATQAPETPPTTAAATRTGVSTATAVATSTTLPPSPTPPFPGLTLEPGDFYLSLDGTQRLLFSRNPTGKTQADFDILLDWTQQGGSQLIRVHITHGWWDDPWILPDGSVNEKWARNWERIFDGAQARGISVLPVFGIWGDWNQGTPDLGSPGWQYNPLNQANGGPFASPGELFVPGSPVQTLWLTWLETLVQRWQGRANIVAWEIFSEVNIATGAQGYADATGGVSKPAGVEFTNRAIEVVRKADSQDRPITISLAGVYADTDPWAEYYQHDDIDFIQIHPYTAELDRMIFAEVREMLSRYHKPVMIGESGLWGEYAIAPNAETGVRHAIWAGLVSGALNARSLWSNDGYAFFEPDRALALEYMGVYATAELPAVKFAQEVDFTGFQPIEVAYPPGSMVWGGALGSTETIIGWFRDAACEPPDWPVRPAIAGQSITLNAAGPDRDWEVAFYDTLTGERRPESATVRQTGGRLVIELPEFSDAIAFKMAALAGSEEAGTPAPTESLVPTSTPAAAGLTDVIAGDWRGTISSTDGAFSTQVELSILAGCPVGQVCGTYAAPVLGCSGDLFLQEIAGEMFVFKEQNTASAAACISGGIEYLQLLTGGSLSYQFSTNGDQTINSSGSLTR